MAGFAAAAGLVGVSIAVMRAPPGSNAAFSAAQTMLAGVECLLAVALFFILADAVRTERTEFTMRAGTLVVWVAMSWLYLASVAAGIALFVLPGVYFAVKLVPWTAYYLLGDEDPLAHTLRDTTGHFWETLAILVVMWLVVQLPLVAVGLVGVFLVASLPAAAIVAAPLVLLVGYYVLTVASLSWIHYSAALRKLGNVQVKA